MTKYIEYTNKNGVRSLVNLSQVSSVIDRNKTVIVEVGDDNIELSISYDSFKAWVKDNESPILPAGAAL